ncbi:MAG TPA: anti-sigma factor [Pyrinomonadaceae bacterium]|jgi:anti-sigma factor RsiW|nr:anti-sigma factor [Pyrinomonadaceae bacterium]
MRCNDVRDLLDAFQDGELDLKSHLGLEHHIEDCSDCRTIFEDRRRLSSAIRGLKYTAPGGLRRRVHARLIDESGSRQSAAVWPWRSLAIAASLVAIILLSLIILRPARPADDLMAAEIVSNHVRSMMANHLTDIPSSDQHTVKPWFDGKLDYAPPVVDLAQQGFPLVGGRLDYAASREIAALVYQRRQHTINLFVFPSTDLVESSSKVQVSQGYNVVHWERSGMTFWAVSDLNLNELREFSEAIQQ